MSEIEQINPRIMVWAHETAGLSLEEAADKLCLETSFRGTGAEKFREHSRIPPVEIPRIAMLLVPRTQACRRVMLRP
jgi:hypothetical protein